MDGVERNPNTLCAVTRVASITRGPLDHFNCLHNFSSSIHSRYRYSYVQPSYDADNADKHNYTMPSVASHAGAEEVCKQAAPGGHLASIRTIAESSFLLVGVKKNTSCSHPAQPLAGLLPSTHADLCVTCAFSLSLSLALSRCRSRLFASSVATPAFADACDWSSFAQPTVGLSSVDWLQQRSPKRHFPLAG